MKASASAPVLVAPHLRPARTFDAACESVVSYLAQVAPMGLWAVTRIVDGRQIVLTADSPGYEIVAGAEIPYAASMCRSMVGGQAPRIAPDVSAVPRYAAVAEAVPITVNAYLGTPIVRPDGELFGTVCGFDPRRQSDSMREHQPLLDLLSNLLSAVLEADTAATATQRELEVARREADTDRLTGLMNRRGWDRFLGAEEERYRRFGDPACVVVLDLDRLKIVNDTQGHEAGDRYIQRAAGVLARTVRAGDVLARLGGDEFGMLAVGASVEQTVELVERLEKALDAAGVSGSIGHAPYSVVAGFPGAWQAADRAMYEQKRRRRRRDTPRRPMTLDPTFAAVLDRLTDAGALPLVQDTTEATRVHYRALSMSRRGPDFVPETLADVTDGVVGTVPVRTYTPQDAHAVVVFLHGGGWVVGDLDTHDPVCRRLANAVSAVVVAVDYRLAPEHPFPAGLDDATAVLRHVAGRYPGRPLAVAGDSAGASIAAGLALRSRDGSAPPLAAQLLVYPATDPSMAQPSTTTHGEGYFLTAHDMAWFYRQYTPDPELARHPHVDLLGAGDVAGVAPAVVATAEFDPLRDEGDAYAARLRAAGVPVTHVPGPGLIHGYFAFLGAVPAADDRSREVLAAFAALLRP